MAARMSELAAVTGGRLVGEDVDFLGAVIDSRKCQPGQLFVALPGAQADGHDYVAAAVARGAAGALVTRALPGVRSQVVVEDALQALQKFAAAHRQQFSGPVIAITGTNGKTTAKEILAAVLAHAMDAEVLYTQGNLNNHIGVPLTLLGLHAGQAAAVIEMGANHAGEIAFLTNITQPNVGIVTMAGAGHLEGFGSVEGVAHAKGELFAGLPEAGVAIINADDDYAPLWRDLAAASQQISFGMTPDADVRAEHVHVEAAGQRFTLQTPVGETSAYLPLSGGHNVMNALAATAAAIAVGVSIDAIAEGLAAANSVGGRLQMLSGPDGARIVDDSYNANPTSVKAAIDWLAQQPGRRWLVLGEMAELGEDAEDWHSQVGAWACEAGIDRLYAYGALTAATVAAFGEGALRCDSHAEIAERLQARLAAQPAHDVTVLVKGSRSMQMERVVNALAAPVTAADSGIVQATPSANGS